jgi:hypothetical protein
VVRSNSPNANSEWLRHNVALASGSANREDDLAAMITETSGSGLEASTRHHGIVHQDQALVLDCFGKSQVLVKRTPTTCTLCRSMYLMPFVEGEHTIFLKPIIQSQRHPSTISVGNLDEDGRRALRLKRCLGRHLASAVTDAAGRYVFQLERLD